MAKRYSEQEKQKILSFVTSHNKENGRGGKTAAAKKFGVNINSIGNWQSSLAGTSAKARKPKKPRVVTARSVAVPKSSDPKVAALHRMVELREQIGNLTEEYEALKKQI